MATAQMRTQVAQLYVSLFGRAPEKDGFTYWVLQLENGQSIQRIAQDMYNVAPSREMYPYSLSNSEIISKFYANVLGRAPDADGLAYWTAQLSTKSVGVVVVDLMSTVASYIGEDSAAKMSTSLFNNKTAIGLQYGFVLGGNSVVDARTVLSFARDGVNLISPPIAVADTFSTVDRAAALIKVLVNDTDVDAGDVLIVNSVSQATYGNVVNNGTTVTYTPDPRFLSGEDSFTYIAYDLLGMASNPATVTVTVGWAQVFTIVENKNLLGLSVGYVFGTDPEGDGFIDWQIIGGDTTGNFIINQATGHLMLSAKANIDYEAMSSYKLVLQATDHSGLKYFQTVKIHVMNLIEDDAGQGAPIETLLDFILVGDDLGQGGRVNDVNGLNLVEILSLVGTSPLDGLV